VGEEAVSKARALDQNMQDVYRAFVKRFVAKNRQDRWSYMLLEQPKQLFQNSSKLWNHLDKRYYSRIDSIGCLDPGARGLFSDFYDPPVWMTLSDAWASGDECDALFVFDDGLRAVYFTHEDENFLCQVSK
jgi:hypothetical protein